MSDEIKEILLKFNKEVEKAELTRNPYSTEDKKFKHILISLSEERFNIFKDTLDYITNLQQENERLKDIVIEKDSQLKDMILQKTDYTAVNILEMKLQDYKSKVEKAIEYIDNFSVDKSFSFPLMKRWEENQVKSSIDYEFQTTLYKDLLNILNGGGKDE